MNTIFSCYSTSSYLVSTAAGRCTITFALFHIHLSSPASNSSFPRVRFSGRTRSALVLDPQIFLFVRRVEGRVSGSPLRRRNSRGGRWQPRVGALDAVPRHLLRHGSCYVARRRSQAWKLDPGRLSKWEYWTCGEREGCPRQDTSRPVERGTWIPTARRGGRASKDRCRRHMLARDRYRL